MWNGSKTEETVLFCFFVVLPPQGQIGLTKLLDSEGQSICLLRLYCLSLSYDICKLARVETIGSTRCSSYHDYTEPKVLEYFNSAQALYFFAHKNPLRKSQRGSELFLHFLKFHRINQMDSIFFIDLLSVHRKNIAIDLIMISNWDFCWRNIKWENSK